MDTIGTLDVAWAQGYDGSRAEYITRDVICYKCGNKIKFVGEDGQESIFPAPPEGLGLIAVQGLGHLFAFSNQVVDPAIYVYQYPSFRTLAELKGGAKLEYTQMTFSSSEYLATISGVPDFELTIWNYHTGQKLTTHDVSSHGNTLPSSVTFNPANWRQLCTTAEKSLCLWQMERSNDMYILHKQKVKLPAVDGSDNDLDEDDSPTRASTRMSRATINVPQTAVAGVKGQEADRFQDYQDDKERVEPTTHVWTPAGEIIMGCKGGQLLRIDAESGSLSMIYNPGPRAISAMSRASHGGNRELSDLAESSTSLGYGNVMTEGSLQCLALHKKGLFAGGVDGTIRQLEISANQMRLLESYPLGEPITSLSFNPAHHKLAIGSDRGSVHIYDPNDPGNMKALFDVHHGDFVGVDTVSAGVDYCVSVRGDGEVQMWQMDNAKLVGSTVLGQQACCLAASPLAHVVAIGAVSGHVYFVDVNQVDNPRIVARLHVHKGPVLQVGFSENGHLLVTGSDDGHIFVIDGRSTKKFEPLGFVAMDGKITAISTHKAEDKTRVVVTSNTTQNGRSGATRVMYFDLPSIVTNDPKSHLASLKCDFKDDAIHKLIYNFSLPAWGAAAAESNTVYTLCQGTRHLNKLQLPTEPPKKEFSKDSYLKPVSEFSGHQLPGGLVKLSPHRKWLASCGSDGRLSVRAVGAMDRAVEVNAHDFRTGGVRGLAFTPDAARMLTIGYDHTLTCYKWSFSNPSKGKSAVDSARAQQMALLKDSQLEDEYTMKLPEWSPGDVLGRPGSSTEKAEKELSEKDQDIEKALENDMIYTTPTPVPGDDATWLDVKEIQAHEEEDKQYTDLKKDLRVQIRDMRRKLQTMMKDNEGIPDIEQLGHHEFDLDLEEQTRLEAEGEAEVNRIREEKEFENLAKMYLAELIKTECWDNMVMKGRGIVAFNTNMEVHNYPMRKRSPADMAELQNVKEQRKVEIEEVKARRELVETGKSKTNTLEEDMNENDDVEGGNGKDRSSTSGSLGAEFGGGSELFYSQFELHTREQKRNQIVLLQDAIYRIKVAFDQEFDTVFEKKEQEIAKIKDKNRRIQKILVDLGLDEEVYEPQLGVIEKPEMLLSVNDEEVTVEKFLTPEQQKKAEEEQKAEEERRLKEKGDNWRDRGLDMMMGGLLEIKKEDELKKDVPQPAFMTAKQEDDWSEDEKKLAQDYEKKVKDLIEEREKYRKQLEMELKKLQSLIQDSTQTFDESLQTLFIRKIKTEMAIYQEELKIERLKYALLMEEELDNREAELSDLLEHKKQLKGVTALAMVEAKKHTEEFHELYRNLEVEEKLLDKNFKKEFNDVPALMADQLYKLFRRRPRGQRARGSETPVHDPHSGSPFSDRPSTAKKNEDHHKIVESSLSELDKESNAPEGCETHVWTRLCSYRREKVANEQLVKQKAQTLADMEEFWKRRQADDEALRFEIENLGEDITKLKEDRLRFSCNLEVQLLLKQGQVEVDAGQYIHDYRGSLLIHRSVVEELNSNIRQLGESKISSMVESKDFRKGIIQLEWEHQKMTMEMEDLQNKMRDIQNLKVTREIQAFLNEDDHDSKKAQEIATLEQTILLMKQHHEKNLQEKKAIIKELKKTIRDKHEENEALSAELDDLNVSVNERRHIHQVNADKRSDVGRELRYKEIVQRRKLVDLAKAQAQEVAVLRAEVERLRMRTFPALVQVEH